MRHASTVLVLSLLVLTGCGGRGSDDGVATATGRKPATGTPSVRPTGDPDEGRLRYTRCMRANGVPHYSDDPKDIPAGTIIPDRAMKACQKLAQAAGMRRLDARDPQTHDRFVKLAQCMRAHGFDWPDPAPGSFGGPPPDLGGVENKARMRQAITECERGWK